VFFEKLFNVFYTLNLATIGQTESQLKNQLFIYY